MGGARIVKIESTSLYIIHFMSYTCPHQNTHYWEFEILKTTKLPWHGENLTFGAEIKTEKVYKP